MFMEEQSCPEVTTRQIALEQINKEFQEAAERIG